MKTLSFDPIRADVAITEKEKSAALHANALLHNGQGAGNDFLGWVGSPPPSAKRSCRRSKPKPPVCATWRR